MGHHISAVALASDFDRQRAASFDLRSIELGEGFTLFPLHWSYCDHWADKLGVAGDVSEQIS
jgi:hypothetical protein